MCSKPLVFKQKDGTKIMAQCRKCDECVKARQRAWIGRMNAEAQTAKSLTFATFTYGGGYDNPLAYNLRYDHLKQTLALLRRRGYRYKYVAVGEYGSGADRAHFHVTFFWDGPEPRIRYNQNIEYEKPKRGQPDAPNKQSFWKHGHVYFERPRSVQGTCAYMMKYMDKDPGVKLKYSKVPALGSEYLIEYAKKHARQGQPLFQNGDRFTIPGNVSSKTQKPFWYPVGPQTKLYEQMIEAYVLEHQTTRPNERLPYSAEIYEQLWDMAQNVDELTAPLKRAVKDLFGITPIHSDYDIAFGNGCYAKGSTIYHLNSEGKETWRETVNVPEATLEVDGVKVLELLRMYAIMHKARENGLLHTQNTTPSLSHFIRNENQLSTAQLLAGINPNNPKHKNASDSQKGLAERWPEKTEEPRNHSKRGALPCAALAPVRSPPPQPQAPPTNRPNSSARSTDGANQRARR